MCDVKIGRLGKFDLNPRGELWLKDENRFGHKFLSKFGWSQGKGLGKNEDGIAENLKVRLKIGNTGVGWNENLPIGIDYREYDAVLENLNKIYQRPGPVKNEDISLEKRSQQFKNRINYQKFVRGKDISRYSEKDMSCIFLSREPEKEMESTHKESTVTNTESSDKSMPTFNSQLSISDYFAMKLKNKIGSSLNPPKESKICEEASQSEVDVKSKKRKHELKSSKKAKQMKLEESVADEDSSASSQDTPEENLASKEQFQNSEETCNSERKKKKSSRKMKKLLGTFKSEQDSADECQENKSSLLHNSYDSCQNLIEESSNMRENEIRSKKRKREQKSFKKAKKPCLEEADVSTSVEEANSSKKCIALNPKTEKPYHKEGKGYKSMISNLKSCLSNNKYSLKEKRNVSFCENISYKIIENNLHSVVAPETEEQLLCNVGEVANETEDIEMNLEDDSNVSGESVEGDKSPLVAEENSVPECFKLPKRSSTNYDSWLETQRIAARMKVYRNMVKKMKKHPVLRKTNLLEIKGYGNWGL